VTVDVTGLERGRWWRTYSVTAETRARMFHGQLEVSSVLLIVLLRAGSIRVARDVVEIDAFPAVFS
jgi:hypothetical protein